VLARVRWSLALAFVGVAFASCQEKAGAGAAGGAGGILLSFAGADTLDCSAAGEIALAGQGGAPDCSTSAPVDYATQVAPIFATCRGEVCHDFSDSNNLRAWIAAGADECCNQRELIAPGHPERSYLLDKLQGRRLCYGAPMPLNRAALVAADLAVIEAWICQGAALP